MLLLGRPFPDPSIPWATIPILVVVFFLPAFCEEVGWMGYMVDSMQERWGAGTASLILGAVWGLWHVVPWLQIHPPTWVAWQCFADLGTRLLIVWLYNNTGKSVFAAILFHDIDNVSNALFPNNGSYYDPAVTGTIIVTTAVIVTFLWGRKTLASFRYTWPSL